MEHPEAREEQPQRREEYTDTCDELHDTREEWFDQMVLRPNGVARRVALHPSINLYRHASPRAGY